MRVLFLYLIIILFSQSVWSGDGKAIQLLQCNATLSANNSLKKPKNIIPESKLLEEMIRWYHNLLYNSESSELMTAHALIEEKLAEYEYYYPGFSEKFNSLLSLTGGMVSNLTEGETKAESLARLEDSYEQLKANVDICNRNHILVSIVLEHLHKGHCSEVDVTELREIKELKIGEEIVGLNGDVELSRYDFFGFYGLETLVIEGAGLTDIPDDYFRDLRNLKELALNGNSIVELKKEHLAPLVSLVVLNISGNNLESFPVEVIASSKIEVIDYSDNDSLPESVISEIEIALSRDEGFENFDDVVLDEIETVLKRMDTEPDFDLDDSYWDDDEI